MWTVRFGAALLVIGGLYACATPEVTEDVPPLTTKPAAVSTPDTATSNDDEDDGVRSPVVVEGSIPGVEVPGVGVEPVDAGADAEVDVDAGPAPVMTLTKSQTCTSKYAAHTSTAKLTWTVTGTKIAITALTVQVHNSDGRNLNDVDVFETQPSAAEVKQFNSGDILVSDKDIIVGFNGNKAPKVGTKVRFSTNFDQSGTDPSASCSLIVQ